ncbi:MAG: hypothetical protein GOV02_04440 [Candidatus Aenigmarchaeota archaeon]|nr:hypothetical protein [Candidatus Aenigmarchaeota archaeon]
MVKSALEEYQDFLAGKSHQQYQKRHNLLQEAKRRMSRYTSEDGQYHFTI